ncbi:hypothetical protein B0H15DRAFT_814106 [Mycena belliarum]|uniref:F-box domain-containing protein n=1 Tax=Mycena belliarum TaxID=1033014 RepID=A0AAD6UG09_9AGAR|nr:hypothetical protein B0H15DRAFT_814106 [Mycena belliae]
MHPPTSPAAILSIPVEILEQILLFCDPRDVMCFSRTCRFGDAAINHAADSYFWRQMFLHIFDDPRQAVNSIPANSSSNWKSELVRRIRAERAAFSGFSSTIDRRTILETFVSVAQDAIPMSDSNPSSRNLEWLDTVLRNSHILDLTFPVNEAKFGNRLKAYMALSLKEDNAHNEEELHVIRTRSRCFVYDLRNYHRRNSWGPFLSNGKVNWSHVEAIINVVQTNLRELPLLDSNPRPPIRPGLQGIRARSAPGDYTGPDWAGVEGTWRRYVCFMDYRDLFAFNFSDALDTGPRDPSFFDDRDFREATRLIELKLHLITRDEMRIRFPSGDPPPPSSPDYPPLYFSGISRGASFGQEASVQGFVFMGLDHLPRWRFTSIHGLEPQWSSEGTQIGHIASAMGVVGAWSAFNHGEGDPAGPFWLWKVSKEPTSYA